MAKKKVTRALMVSEDAFLVPDELLGAYSICIKTGSHFYSAQIIGIELPVTQSDIEYAIAQMMLAGALEPYGAEYVDEIVITITDGEDVNVTDVDPYTVWPDIENLSIYKNGR